MKNSHLYLVRICLVLVLLFISIPGKAADRPSEAQAGSRPRLDIQELSYKTFLPLVANQTDFLPVLTIWTSPDNLVMMQQIAAGYEATHNVHVIVEEKGYNLREEFSLAAPAGTGPDIAIFPHDQIGNLVASGLLESIEIGPMEADFTPSALDAVRFADVYYGLPFAVENLALVYNIDLVPTPPTTWEALHTLGQSLQASGHVTWGFVLTGSTYDAYPLMTALGGYVFGRNPDGTWNTNDLGIDSAGMIAFGETAIAWVDEGFMSPNYDWGNSHTMFETGQVPWIMAGPWALQRFRDSGIHYGVTNFPSGIPFSGVQTFVINAMSNKKALAHDFLTEYVATTDVMLQLYEMTNRPPAYIPALALIDDPDLIAFGQAGLNAEPMPNIPEMGCVWAAWESALSFILNGQKTPTQAYTEAAAAIRSCIDHPLTGMVNVPGSFQTEVGCDVDWYPACVNTELAGDTDGLYMGVFTLPAGTWECRVALD